MYHDARFEVTIAVDEGFINGRSNEQVLEDIDQIFNPTDQVPRVYFKGSGRSDEFVDILLVSCNANEDGLHVVGNLFKGEGEAGCDFMDVSVLDSYDVTSHPPLSNSSGGLHDEDVTLTSIQADKILLIHGEGLQTMGFVDVFSHGHVSSHSIFVISQIDVKVGASIKSNKGGFWDLFLFQ